MLSERLKNAFKNSVVCVLTLSVKKKSAKNLVGKKISHLAKISHFLPLNFLF